jgi:hypothetical protein
MSYIEYPYLVQLPQYIGSAIEDKRKKQKMTQKDLADITALLSTWTRKNVWSRKNAHQRYPRSCIGQVRPPRPNRQKKFILSIV